VHFAQNAIAFVILARTSPVTYSIASLVKRVVVICMAVVWFAQRVHPVQALGIALTSVGLWLYNGAKADVAAGERRVRRVERARDLALPSTNAELAAEQMDGTMPAYAPPPTSPATVRGRRGTLAPLATDGAHLRGAAAPLSIRITPPSAHPANAKGYPSPPDSPEHPETRSTAVEAR
jgi:solute carrier family 35 protein E1